MILISNNNDMILKTKIYNIFLNGLIVYKEDERLKKTK